MALLLLRRLGGQVWKQQRRWPREVADPGRACHIAATQHAVETRREIFLIRDLHVTTYFDKGQEKKEIEPSSVESDLNGSTTRARAPIDWRSEVSRPFLAVLGPGAGFSTSRCRGVGPASPCERERRFCSSVAQMAGAESGGRERPRPRDCGTEGARLAVAQSARGIHAAAWVQESFVRVTLSLKSLPNLWPRRALLPSVLGNFRQQPW